jgi:ribonuclease J
LCNLRIEKRTVNRHEVAYPSRSAPNWRKLHRSFNGHYTAHFGRWLAFGKTIATEGKPPKAGSSIRHAQANPVDVLLMEGTNISRPHEGHLQTEEELVDALQKEITECPGLVLANFSPQHVDRFVSFYKAARRARRRFVVDVYGAFVWHLASGQIKIPKLAAKAGIHVYYNQSFERSWRRRNLKKVHDLFLGQRMDLAEILDEPERYAMLFRSSMIDWDFKGVLPRQTTCIYSFWPGYLVQPEYRMLKTELAEADGKFVECHTSVHIFAEDIVKFVRAINPRHIVPIHTIAPKRFHELFPNAISVRDGEPLNL